MARAGVLDYVMFAMESAYGTPPSTLDESLPVEGFSLAGENTGREVPIIANTREYLKFPDGNYSVGGTIDSEFFADPCGYLLYGLMGDETHTSMGTKGHKHEFSLAQTTPSFTFGTDIQGTKIIYTGCKINSLTLNANRGDNDLKLSADIIAQKDMILPTGTTFDTYTYPAVPPLSLGTVSLKINSATASYIRSVSLTFNNNMTPDDWRVLTSGRFISNVEGGSFLVTGTFESLFDLDLIEYRWGLTGATEPQSTITKYPFELEITGINIETNVDYKLTIELPSIYIRTASAPLTTDVVVVTGDFTAVYDATKSYSTKITLINQHDSYEPTGP